MKDERLPEQEHHAELSVQEAFIERAGVSRRPLKYSTDQVNATRRARLSEIYSRKISRDLAHISY
jgi:hypothetical protein